MIPLFKPYMPAELPELDAILLKIKGKLESELGDYRDYFINLRDAILGKTEIAVKAEEARNVMHIIELAFHSSKEKKTIAVE